VDAIIVDAVSEPASLHLQALGLTGLITGRRRMGR
jgi:hypothetical protein